MTFSILSFDTKTGVFAGAAATGSLCVGGWVLRGDIESGLVASQGTAPSSFWRDDVLRAMYDGQSAVKAVDRVTGADAGRGHRQLSALDRYGAAQAFTGQDSVPYAGHLVEQDLVIAGNMLTGPEVLDAMRRVARDGPADPAERMFAVLNAALKAGGDSRGLQSAAMLILKPNAPPLDIRVDYDPAPIATLERLYQRTQSSPYNDWLHEVPVVVDKSRAPNRP